MEKERLNEIGAVGTEIYSGQIVNEEYNTDLADAKAIEVYRKMPLKDAKIKGVLNAINLAVRSAIWTIEPASDDPKHVEQAKFIEQNILANPNFTWDFFLSHALKYLQYGFYIFEKVYEYRDGKYWLKKLAPRKPNTIIGWYQNPDGSLKEIEQLAYFPDGTYKTVRIPNNKLLIFTNEREGNNWRGVSILRPLYRAYYAKDTLIKIALLKHDKQGLGIPIIKLPQINVTENDEDKAVEVGETFRAHSKGYVILPHGFEFEILDMKASQTSDLESTIKYFDQEMSTALLQQFLDLGKTETGSRALGKTLKDQFLQSLLAITKEIENTINTGHENRKLIQELIDWNFGMPENNLYPKLRGSYIEDINLTEIANSINVLVNSGALKLNEEDEKIIRKWLELPEVQKKEIEEQPQKEEEEKKEEREEIKSKENICKCLSEKNKAEELIEYWRPLTDLENLIGLRDIDKKIREFRNKMAEIALQHRAEFIKLLTDRGMRILAKTGGIDAIMAEIRRTSIVTKKLEEELAQIAMELAKYSKEELQRELKLQGLKLADTPKPIIEDEGEIQRAIKRIIETKIKAMIRLLEDEWEDEILSQKLLNMVNTQRLQDRLSGLSEKSVRNAMAEATNKIFGLARNAEAMKHKEQIEIVIRSEVMDEKTCGPCKQVDGLEFSLDSPEADSFLAGPYVDCDGGDNCRGINIFEISKEK